MARSVLGIIVGSSHKTHQFIVLRLASHTTHGSILRSAKRNLRGLPLFISKDGQNLPKGVHISTFHRTFVCFANMVLYRRP